jgi:DNA-binding IclR family transcriptional regulator
MEFMPNNQSKGLVELSKRTGIHPSTVSRLLHGLSLRGFIEQDVASKKFVLGKTVADLGRAFLHSLQGNLVNIARPVIDELSDRIEETIALEIWSGSGTVLACRTLARHKLQVSGETGSRMPIHAAAGAKAILAHSEPDFVNRALGGRFEKFTQNTVTEPASLKDQFEKIRKEGVAFDREEVETGVFAIGAPIFDAREEPVAGIVLTFPINRLETCYSGENVSKLKDAAREISSRLLHSHEKEGMADIRRPKP